MTKVTNSIKNKLKNIELVITDVDGVLTDGGMYYTAQGDSMKKFHTRDGMGVNLLKKSKIPTIIVTKEKTKMVRNWAKKMNISHVYDGVQQKEKLLKEICKKYAVTSSQIAYIGDDVNDLELLKKVGFSATPKLNVSLELYIVKTPSLDLISSIYVCTLPSSAFILFK